MHISDWSSDVCSSDLGPEEPGSSSTDRRLGDDPVRSRVRVRPVAIDHDGDVFSPVPRNHAAERHVSADVLVALSGVRKPSACNGAGDRIVFRESHRAGARTRSEEHTSELQSLMRISYAVFCLKKKNIHYTPN